MDNKRFSPDHHQYQAFMKGLTELYRSTGLRPMRDRCGYMVVTNRTNPDLPYECPFPEWDHAEREYVTRAELESRQRVQAQQSHEAKARALYEELKVRFGQQKDGEPR